jgi:hypothetical protein
MSNLKNVDLIYVQSKIIVLLGTKNWKERRND